MVVLASREHKVQTAVWLRSAKLVERMRSVMLEL